MIGFKKMRKLTKTYLLILSLLTILSVLSMRYVWSEHHPDFLYLIPIFSGYLGICICSNVAMIER